MKQAVVKRRCGCVNRVHYVSERTLQWFRDSKCQDCKTEADRDSEDDMTEKKGKGGEGWVVLDWGSAEGDNPRFVAVRVGARDTDDCPVRVAGIYHGLDAKDAALAEAERLNTAEAAPKAEKSKEVKGKATAKGKGKGAEAVKLASLVHDAARKKGKAKRARKGA